MQSLGLIGITSIGGANAAAKSDWSGLAGRKRLFVLPDNNSPGERYLNDIATIVSAFDDPPEIIVVRLPDLPDGGDVIDWIKKRLPDWDGYSPIPESERGRLRCELLDTIKDHSKPYSNPEAKAAPIPLEKNPHENLPPFPMRSLPKVLRQATEEIARFNKVPRESPGTIALSMTTTAIGKNAQVIERPGLEHYPALFFGLIAGSGDRKSPPYKQLQKPSIDFSIEQAPKYEKEVRKVNANNAVIESRIKKLIKDAEKKDTEHDRQKLAEEIETLEGQVKGAPVDLQRFTSDYTEQQLFRLMHRHNGQFAIQSGEGRPVFDSILGKYSGDGKTGDSIILAGISGDTITRNRVGHPETGGEENLTIYDPCLNVCVMVQPDKYLECAQHPNLRASGTLARIFPVWLPSLVGTRLEQKNEPGLILKELSGYYDLINRLLKLERKKPHRASLSADAAEARRLYHNEIEQMMGDEGDFNDVRDIACKICSQTVKLALVLHIAAKPDRLNKDQSEISFATWEKAASLGFYYLNQSVASQRYADEDQRLEPARRILNWMQSEAKKGETTFPFAEILQRSRRPRPKAKELASIMGILVEHNLVTELHSGGKRPSYQLVGFDHAI